MPFYLRLISPNRKPRFASQGHSTHDQEPIPFSHPDDPSLLALALNNQRRGGSHLVIHLDSPPSNEQLAHANLDKPHAQESTNNPVEPKTTRKPRKNSSSNNDDDLGDL